MALSTHAVRLQAIWGVLGAIGAIAAFIGLAEFYGYAGAVAMVGVGFVVVALWSSQDYLVAGGGSWGAIRHAWMNDLVVRLYWFVGVILVAGAVAGYFFGVMRLTFGREDFLTSQRVLRIKCFENAANKFGISAPTAKGRDAISQDAFKKQEWLRWMTASFEQPRSVSIDGKSVEEFHTLVYVESFEFDDDFDKFTALLEVDTSVARVVGGVAFLVRGADHDPWYRPTFRQMDLTLAGDQDSQPVVRLDKPVDGEAVAVFLEVIAVPDSGKPPVIREAFPNRHHFGVK